MTLAATLWAIALPCLILFGILGLASEALELMTMRQRRKVRKARENAPQARKAHVCMFLPKEPQSLS